MVLDESSVKVLLFVLRGLSSRSSVQNKYFSLWHIDPRQLCPHEPKTRRRPFPWLNPKNHAPYRLFWQEQEAPTRGCWILEIIQEKEKTIQSTGSPFQAAQSPIKQQQHPFHSSIFRPRPRPGFQFCCIATSSSSTTPGTTIGCCFFFHVGVVGVVRHQPIRHHVIRPSPHHHDHHLHHHFFFLLLRFHHSSGSKTPLRRVFRRYHQTPKASTTTIFLCCF
jgi:hypothetical protein